MFLFLKRLLEPLTLSALEYSRHHFVKCGNFTCGPQFGEISWTCQIGRVAKLGLAPVKRSGLSLWPRHFSHNLFAVQGGPGVDVIHVSLWTSWTSSHQVTWTTAWARQWEELCQPHRGLQAFVQVWEQTSHHVLIYVSSARQLLWLFLLATLPRHRGPNTLLIKLDHIKSLLDLAVRLLWRWRGYSCWPSPKASTPRCWGGRYRTMSRHPVRCTTIVHALICGPARPPVREAGTGCLGVKLNELYKRAAW